MLKEKVQGLSVKAMEVIEKHNKKVLVGLLVVAVCGVGGCSGQSSINSDKNGTIRELETRVEELTAERTKLAKEKRTFKKERDTANKENKALTKEVEKAKEYLDLDDNEKELVDIKIKEVNEATEKAIEEEKARKEEERIAKEKAEAEEKARKEAEEQAKKEAEEKAKAEDACVYAVDNVTVDWNEQCAKKAKSYLDYTSFSRQGLYGQLEFEGFTHEQIEYGLSAVGY